MRAVIAIAHDTLTLLCRRRLFWLNLWLSLAVVLLVASIACTPTGWSLGFGLKTWPSSYLKSGSPWEITLYFGVVRRAVAWWVTGVAPLLALFSMASVIPKTLKSGQAALVFPKSRGRSEVLLGRFTGGLLFAAIPAVLTLTGLFLTLILRLGLWEWNLFLCLPFCLLFFATLSAVTVALGILTKSSSASLLVTLLFTASVFALQDAASRPADIEDEGEFKGMVRSSTSLNVLQAIAWPLPRTHDLMEGLDRAIGLRAPRLFRDLIRRWRIGKFQVGAAAAEAFDANEAPPSEPVTPLKLSEAIMVTTGFTCLTLTAAALMLKRRDL